MKENLKNLVEKIEKRGEQLWFVRIVPKNGGKIERWIVSPITKSGRFDDRIISSLKSVITENSEAEDWDCVYDHSKKGVRWICTLRKSSKHTGSKGHVFKVK